VNAPTRSVYERLHRAIELLANVGIIAVAVLGSAVLVRQLMSAQSPASLRTSTERRAVEAPRPPAPAVGSSLSVPGVGFDGADQTLVMALSTQCHFCSDSAPFYKRLAEATARTPARTKLVAVLPQPRDPALSFLKELGVGVADVVQAPPSAVGARGTPTLILVNRAGVVLRTWIGQLAPEKETEVLTAVSAASTKGAS